MNIKCMEWNVSFVQMNRYPAYSEPKKYCIYKSVALEITETIPY